ncbi:hypothetical protein WJX82_010965 [Trebouxia sp. C0006]
MESLVDRGLVRSIGVSNFSPEKIQTLLKTARIRPAVKQVEVHCHWRNDRTVDWCKKEGIHVTACAPLSSPQTMSLEHKDIPNLLTECRPHTLLDAASCIIVPARLHNILVMYSP